ncbi:cell Wall and Capsule [Methylobacterium phyllosphaerae]|uniref:Capsular polysaccharide biosynthesis protein n=1 Tax=Methylobacterium phyllosphaerae TaxID=418223 RepID=A0AAE8HUW4_9HYPH|nr:glycosyltransferase 61 family protein [Methylobacterium phyllosphaerae]APT30062.1 cell Wall and Capsule [Methylobacterium phyllosphaerae]SFH31724.1 Capsular polysaccharide biosynthesis protein [Methylobacterium phyllosphaerae]
MVTFLDLVRSIDSGNAAHVLDRLGSLLEAERPSGSRAAATLRHLEALGFRLEGGARFADAARAYELAAAIDPHDPARWHRIAIAARLRGFIDHERWDDASAFVAAIRGQDEAGPALHKTARTLLQLGWDHECRGRAEPAVQCYRLAYALNGGDAGLATVDGDSLSQKIRNLRILQMNALAEAGRHEEAVVLHESTRSIVGLGPVGIYRIVSARQEAGEGHGRYHELRSGRRIANPGVTFLDGPIPLTSQPGTLDAPPQYVAFFQDCLTFPRSNVVLHGDRLIYDLAAHPLSGVADIKDGVNPSQIMTAVWAPERALVEAPSETREIEAGLMLFGLQSRQYGHWLLEFVPRMLCFNDPACPSGLPLCIDDGMPETHRQIVALMDTRDRPIVTLPPVATRFRELGLAPVPAFFPFDTRPGLPIYDAIWPQDILAAVRDRILERLAADGVDLRRTGRRIILSRRGFTQRQLVNEAEIVETLRPHGFEVVQPEQLTFAEQVQMYHAADIIVGSASSALINCIFCRPGTQVVALAHESQEFYFRGFTSFVESSGARLLFVRGTTLQAEGVHPMHANYMVPPATMRRALEKVTVAL